MSLPLSYVNTFSHPDGFPYHQAARKGGIVIVRNPPGEPTFAEPLTIVPVPPALVGHCPGTFLIALDMGHPLGLRVAALRILRRFQSRRTAARKAAPLN